MVSDEIEGEIIPSNKKEESIYDSLGDTMRNTKGFGVKKNSLSHNSPRKMNGL